MFPIAYIAGQFPLRSETFVWREVRELRRRGWPVHTFGLHPPEEQTPADLSDLRSETLDVYHDRPIVQASPGNASRGLPARLKVAGLSMRDMLWPGEPLGLRGRISIEAQKNAGRRLAGWLGPLGVRHIHAHFAHSPASVAMYAARLLNIPFSFTGHANDLFQRRQLLKRKLERASFVACISEWHRGLYQSITPRGEALYPVIRCGVDTDSFTPREPADAASSMPHLVTVCRLVEKKGVDLLLRALARLRQLKVDLRLTIGGDGPLRSALEALARELSLQDRVSFAGALDAAQVRKLLGTADLFALPCRIDSKGDRDGIPVVLMEAMACGLPVVSGDLPAIRELVIDQSTGLLVNPREIDALAGAIGLLADDSILSARLGKSGRKRVLDEFSLKGNVDLLEQRFVDSVSR